MHVLARATLCRSLGFSAIREFGVLLAKAVPALATMTANALSGLDLLATAVMLIDEHERVRYMNPAAENLFGLSTRNAEGTPLETLFNGSPVLAAAIGYARDNNCSYSEHDLALTPTGHAPLHLSCTVTPVDFNLDVGGGFLIEFRHIEQQLKIAREE